ncbi:MAG: hypothetical protein RL405_891 [Actinomycetota bacterium]
MKKLFWFATGIAAGLAVAKQLRENPEAKAAVDEAAKRARAIGEAFTTGYKERESELNKPKTAPARATSVKPKAKAAPKRKSAAAPAKRAAAKSSTSKTTAK